jgi:hypothetical protein
MTKALTAISAADREVGERLAAAWADRIKAVHSDMAVKAIELKLGFVEDLMDVAGYRKGARGMGPVIEAACAASGWKSQSIYDCVAVYERWHVKGQSLAKTASRVYEEFGSWRKALGKGEESTAGGKSGEDEAEGCAHCPIHCPRN